MIVLENRPLRYFLSAFALTAQEPKLILWLHRSLVEHEVFRSLSPDQDGVRLIAADNDGGVFQGNLVSGSKFGFGGALEVGEWTRDFLPLMIPFPVCEHEDGPCHMCKGNPGDVTQCYFCNKTGKNTKVSYDSLWPVVSTLVLVFDAARSDEALFGPKPQQQPHPSQPLTVEMAANKKDGIFAISGMYGIPLVAWLATLPPSSRLEPVVTAMKTVDHRLFPFGPEDDFSFRVVAEQNGWLNISCRGEACGLHPDHHGIQPGRGVEFMCHNIDQPGQLMTLLAALAALTDMAILNHVAA